MSTGALFEKRINIHQNSPNLFFVKLHEEKNKFGTNLSKTPFDYIGYKYNKHGTKIVCFDAKSTKLKNLPLKNLKAHQNKALIKAKQRGCISFLLIEFSTLNRHFIADLSILDNITGESIPLSKFEREAKEINIQELGKEIYEYDQN